MIAKFNCSALPTSCAEQKFNCSVVPSSCAEQKQCSRSLYREDAGHTTGRMLVTLQGGCWSHYREDAGHTTGRLLVTL